jgi:hypothetical protein
MVQCFIGGSFQTGEPQCASGFQGLSGFDMSQHRPEQGAVIPKDSRVEGLVAEAPETNYHPVSVSDQDPVKDSE